MVSSARKRMERQTYAAAAINICTLEISLAKAVKPIAKSTVNPPIHISFCTFDCAAVVVKTAMAKVGTTHATIVETNDVPLLIDVTGMNVMLSCCH